MGLVVLHIDLLTLIHQEAPIPTHTLILILTLIHPRTIIMGPITITVPI
jgi:hypothetical protein